MIFSRRNRRRSDEFLKYEEGDVIPVESKHPIYPPFLNDADQNSVKEFKDMIRNEKTPARSKNAPERGMGESRTRKTTIFFRLLWFAIICLLVYHSIPVFRYFYTETTKFVNQAGTEIQENTIGGVDETINRVIEDTGKAVSALKEKREQLERDARDALLNNPDFDRYDLDQPDGPAVDSSETTSHDGWIDLITSSQNTKQELVKKIRRLTEGVAGVEISSSRYRMELKGISTKAERQLSTIEAYKNNTGSQAVYDTLNALIDEYTHLQDWVVELSSADPSLAVHLFNEGAEVQNRLTEKYKQELLELLKERNYSYTMENGVISVR